VFHQSPDGSGQGRTHPEVLALAFFLLKAHHRLEALVVVTEQVASACEHTDHVASIGRERSLEGQECSAVVADAFGIEGGKLVGQAIQAKGDQAPLIGMGRGGFAGAGGVTIESK